MEDRGGRIELLLPYATLEPIRKMLLQQFMGEKFGRDNIWEGHLATELWTTQMEVRAVLDEQQLPLSRVLNMQVGDTHDAQRHARQPGRAARRGHPADARSHGAAQPFHRRPRRGSPDAGGEEGRAEAEMSLVALAMNGFLAVLLIAALIFGWRLERRLKALRDSHEGFAKAVADLDQAAARAEQGLADLRAATDEAAETLAVRIERAQALAAQLEERVNRPSSPIIPSAADREAPRPARATEAPSTAAQVERRLSAADFERLLEREDRVELRLVSHRRRPRCRRRKNQTQPLSLTCFPCDSPPSSSSPP